MLWCFFNVCKQLLDHTRIGVNFINWGKRIRWNSQWDKELCSFFWGRSWKGGNSLWMLGPPLPTPGPKYHVTGCVHLVFEELGTSLEDLFLFTRCKYVLFCPQGGRYEIEKGGVIRSGPRVCQLWIHTHSAFCHLPFEQNLNLWGKNIGGSDEFFFFLLANHGFLILSGGRGGKPQRKGSTGFLDIK